MAIEAYKIYRLFCKSSPKNNVTVVNGGSVVGTKFNIQPYLSNSTWQYVATGNLTVDPNDTRGVSGTRLSFQCNWTSPQIYGILFPAITAQSTKVDGEQVKLNTSDSSVSTYSNRVYIKFVPSNSKVTINSCEYDGYYLEFSNGKVLDARDSYLSVYDNAGLDSQIFAFVPDTALRDTVTSSISIGSLDVDLNSTKTNIVSLINSTVDCQARIRKAPLYHNMSSFSDYGDYETPAGSKQDDGYGNGWQRNTGTSFSLEVEAANTTKGIDAWKYEITYRALYIEGSHAYHHNECLQTYTSRQNMSYSIDSALISADGLKIAWSSNAYRDEGATTVKLSDVTEDGTLVCNGRTQTFTSAKSGTFEIPYSELQRYPVTGSVILVKMQFSLNSSYAVGSATLNKNVVVTATGGDLEPVIDVDTDNGYDLTLTISEKTGQAFDVCECSMIYEQNGDAVVKELAKTDTNTFFAPARINADTFITVNIEDTTQTTTKWGVTSYTHTYDTRIPTTLVLNSENMEFEFKYSNEQWPGSKSVGPTTSSLHKAGKRLPDYYYETNYDNKFSIDSLRFDTADLYKLEMVLREKYLAVRNSKGYYANCAFLGKTTKEIDENTTECTLEFAEVDRDVDVAIPY